MDGFTKFRASLGGFNREDVCAYITGSAREKQNQLQSLTEENQKLRGENDALRQEAITLRADMTDYETLAAREASREETQRLAQLERLQLLERANRLTRQLEEFCTATETILADAAGQTAQMATILADKTRTLVTLVGDLRTAAQEAAIVFQQADEGEANQN